LPFFIPDGEALDVHLNGLPAGEQRGNPLDHERLGDQPVAAVAVLPGGRTTPDSGNAVQQANDRRGASGEREDESQRITWGNSY
jgi:hypothetical protein